MPKTGCVHMQCSMFGAVPICLKQLSQSKCFSFFTSSTSLYRDIKKSYHFVSQSFPNINTKPPSLRRDVNVKLFIILFDFGRVFENYY